uniref:Uncharacterized protein n=1 Tax=viral metagenome TaxID=1070528 RepID=A0A6C0K8X8_9ZZZZ
MPFKNRICRRGATCHFARAGKCTYAHLELGDKIGDWCPSPVYTGTGKPCQIRYEVLPDNTLYVQWFGHSSGQTVRMYCKGLTSPPCYSQNVNLTLDDEKHCLDIIRRILDKVERGMPDVVKVKAKRRSWYTGKFEQAMFEDGMLGEKPPKEPQYPPKSRAVDFSSFAMFSVERSGFEKSLDCFGGQPPSSKCFFTPSVPN